VSFTLYLILYEDFLKGREFEKYEFWQEENQENWENEK
jgi:hypothetical protein